MNRASLAVIAIILLACSRLDKAPYTESDVRDFVHPGTPGDAIVRRFGQPVFEEENPKSDGDYTGVDKIIYYSLPPRYYKPNRNGNAAFVGFQVRLKEGKTVDWSSAEEIAWQVHLTKR